jgi:hypothetical protein
LSRHKGRLGPSYLAIRVICGSIHMGMFGED